jgi:hypothetical protein
MAKDALVGKEKEKDAGENLKSPPKQETDSHKESGLTAKFYGDTQGNKDRNPDLSDGSGGGSGESHPFKASQGPFIGDTKGNKDRPIDLSKGTGGGEGGKYVAGRGKKVFSGNKGGF